MPSETITVVENKPAPQFAAGLKVYTGNLSSISGVFNLVYQGETKSVVVYMNSKKYVDLGDSIFTLELTNPHTFVGYDGRVIHSATLKVTRVRKVTATCPGLLEGYTIIESYKGYSISRAQLEDGSYRYMAEAPGVKHYVCGIPSGQLPTKQRFTAGSLADVKKLIDTYLSEPTTCTQWTTTADITPVSRGYVTESISVRNAKWTCDGPYAAVTVPVSGVDVLIKALGKTASVPITNGTATINILDFINKANIDTSKLPKIDMPDGTTAGEMYVTVSVPGHNGGPSLDRTFDIMVPIVTPCYGQWTVTATFSKSTAPFSYFTDTIGVNDAKWVCNGQSKPVNEVNMLIKALGKTVSVPVVNGSASISATEFIRRANIDTSTLPVIKNPDGTTAGKVYVTLTVPGYAGGKSRDWSTYILVPITVPPTTTCPGLLEEYTVIETYKGYTISRAQLEDESYKYMAEAPGVQHSVCGIPPGQLPTKQRFTANSLADIKRLIDIYSAEVTCTNWTVNADISTVSGIYSYFTDEIGVRNAKWVCNGQEKTIDGVDMLITAMGKTVNVPIVKGTATIRVSDLLKKANIDPSQLPTVSTPDGPAGVLVVTVGIPGYSGGPWLRRFLNIHVPMVVAPTACQKWKTIANVIVSASVVKIGNAKWVCNGQEIPVDNVNATITVMGRKVSLPVSGGSASISVTELLKQANIDVTDITGSWIPVTVHIPGYQGGDYFEKYYNIPSAGVSGVTVKPVVRLGTQVKLVVQKRLVEGQSTTLFATGYCKGQPLSGNKVRFYVDGKLVDSGAMANGAATGSWVATSEPSRKHKICVEVDGNGGCDPGRDCTTVTVVHMGAETLEQLERERQQFLRALERQRRAREKAIRVRGIFTPAPAEEFMEPVVTISPVTEAPAPAVAAPARQGVIRVPRVEVPAKFKKMPVHILVDGRDEGPPPLRIRVTPGSHTVTAIANGIVLATSTVTVKEGKTVKVVPGKVVLGGR